MNRITIACAVVALLIFGALPAVASQFGGDSPITSKAK